MAIMNSDTALEKDNTDQANAVKDVKAQPSEERGDSQEPSKPPPRRKPRFESNATTLFVGGLHPSVTEELLFELFLQAGPVENVLIPTANGRSKGFAFVNYEDGSVNDYAIELYNDLYLYSLPIQVRLSDRGRRAQGLTGSGYRTPGARRSRSPVRGHGQAFIADARSSSSDARQGSGSYGFSGREGSRSADRGRWQQSQTMQSDRRPRTADSYAHQPHHQPHDQHHRTPPPQHLHHQHHQPPQQYGSYRPSREYRRPSHDTYARPPSREYSRHDVRESYSRQDSRDVYPQPQPPQLHRDYSQPPQPFREQRPAVDSRHSSEAYVPGGILSSPPRQSVQYSHPDQRHHIQSRYEQGQSRVPHQAPHYPQESMQAQGHYQSQQHPHYPPTEQVRPPPSSFYSSTGQYNQGQYSRGGARF